MLITSSVHSSQSGDSFQNDSYFTVIIHERGGGVKFVSLMIGVGNYWNMKWQGVGQISFYRSEK